jgi:hypothetical protein
VIERCFKLKDSNPPYCGVHNVLLQLGEALIDPLAPFLGLINYLKCPISDMVVLNSDENEPGDIWLRKFD